LPLKKTMKLRSSLFIGLGAWIVSTGCASGSSISGSESTAAQGGPGGSSATSNGTRTGAGGDGAATSSSGVGGETGTGGAGGKPPEGCGDGNLGAGEDCEGSDLGGATCTSIGQGFVGGDLACSGTCAFDTSGCEAPPDCGNGAIDGTEDCDGTNLGGATCGTLGHGAGTLSCTAGCVFDQSSCYTCGDGAIEGNEVCDGANLGGNSCLSFSHDGGTLLCAGNCLSFNESSCTDCGDGQVEGTELCDSGNLGGQSCATLGFAGGSLSCTSSCTFNTGACQAQVCGDNVRQGNEVCDGTALNGQTCVSQGFNGGSLACAGNCMAFNTAGCFGGACSDGLDNDGDGNVDANDPGCTSPTDTDESIFADTCNGVGGPIYDVTLAGGVDVVVTGSTVGLSNNFGPTDFTGDCQSATGGEVILFYRLATAKNGVLITTDNPGTNFDTVIYVRQANCNPGQVELCDDDSGFFFSSNSSELFLNMPAGDYFIFVDGYGGQSGNYELLIDLP
jgi:hypothetical protein